MSKEKLISNIIGRALNESETKKISDMDIISALELFKKKEEKKINTKKVLGLDRIENMFPRIKKVQIVLQRLNVVDPKLDVPDLKWDISSTYSPGNILVDKHIGNIISIKMLDFCFNFGIYKTDLSTTEAVREYKTKTLSVRYPYHSNETNITFLIKELSEQSIISPFGQNFHFMGVLDYTGFSHESNEYSQVIRFTKSITFYDIDLPDDEITNLNTGSHASKSGVFMNNGIYEFRNPISSLSSITLSMYQGTKKHIFYGMVIDGLTFYGFDGIYPVWSMDFSNIPVRDNQKFPNILRVKLRGFTTSEPILDKTLIDQINENQIFTPTYAQDLLVSGVYDPYQYISLLDFNYNDDSFIGVPDYDNIEMIYVGLDFYIPMEITYIEN